MSHTAELFHRRTGPRPASSSAVGAQQGCGTYCPRTEQGREGSNHGNHALAAMPGLRHEPHGKHPWETSRNTWRDLAEGDGSKNMQQSGALYCNVSLHDSSQTVRPLRAQSCHLSYLTLLPSFSSLLAWHIVRAQSDILAD